MAYFSPKPTNNKPVTFHVTLWPEFDHFPRFSRDDRIAGIRLNSAMMAASEINERFRRRAAASTVPLWFDVKGMQMRIKEVVCDHTHDHLEFILNRPVKVATPCTVYFKAGEDAAKLIEIQDGTHFIFDGGPQYEVKAGESIHILQPDCEVGGPLLLDYEREKIERIKSLGFTRWYLSYVYDQRHVDEFREVIGPDARLILKIENKAGLDYVAEKYQPMRHTCLMAARGDLYVEVDRPHEILNACKLVVEKDPDALVGSRMLLSVIPPKGVTLPPWRAGVPSCADFSELAWLYEIGYRNFLLCDELCLKDQLLASATDAFDAFRQDYR
jgi:pyruvate kinase